MRGSALKKIASNLERGLQLAIALQPPLPCVPGGEDPWEMPGIEAALGPASSRVPSGCAGAAQEAVRLSHRANKPPCASRAPVNRARSATMGH